MRYYENMDRKERYEQWKARLEKIQNSVYEVVKPVIDRYDIESLRKMGAPEDEYDHISREIAEAIVSEGGSFIGVEGISNILTLIFHINFQGYSTAVRYGLNAHPYTAMAEELLPLLPDCRRAFTIPGAHSPSK